MTKETIDADVVLIGCGKMGSALGAGLVESGVLEPGRLHCCDRDADRAVELAESTGARELDAEELYEAVAELEDRIFVVAVKPGDVRSLLERGRPHFETGDMLVSIAAGVPTGRLGEWSGGAPRLVRAMPNVAALVGRGVTGVYAPGEADLQLARSLFRGVGGVVELDEEDDFDALTAVSGSGPAYVFTALEALADGAVSAGLDRETAVELAVETLYGASALARSRSAHTAELKDEVTSPGGTTAAGLVQLERHGFRSALIEAVRAAADKSAEMSSELADD